MGWINARENLPPVGIAVRWKWIDHISHLNVGVYAPMSYSHEFKDYYVWDGRSSYIDPENTRECYWFQEEESDREI